MWGLLLPWPRWTLGWARRRVGAGGVVEFWGCSNAVGAGGLSGGVWVGGVGAARWRGPVCGGGVARHRAHAAGKVLAPVAGLCSTTAAGLARRFTDGQWHAVETGIGDIGAAMLAALPAERAAACVRR